MKKGRKIAWVLAGTMMLTSIPVTSPVVLAEEGVLVETFDAGDDYQEDCGEHMYDLEEAVAYEAEIDPDETIDETVFEEVLPREDETGDLKDVYEEGEDLPEDDEAGDLKSAYEERETETESRETDSVIQEYSLEDGMLSVESIETVSEPVSLLSNENAKAVGNVAINEEHFPDEGFREYVKSEDADGDGILSAEEIANVTEIGFNAEEIYNLIGIEYFTNLKCLYCGGSSIDELDLSKNT